MAYVYRYLEYILTVAMISLVILLLAPLAILIYDFLVNPTCFTFTPNVEGIQRVEDNIYRVPVTISYCSSIELRDVKLGFNTTVIQLPELKKGNYTLILVIRENETLNYIEFKVLGLYRIVYKIGV